MDKTTERIEVVLDVVNEIEVTAGVDVVVSLGVVDSEITGEEEEKEEEEVAVLTANTSLEEAFWSVIVATPEASLRCWKLGG